MKKALVGIAIVAVIVTAVALRVARRAGGEPARSIEEIHAAEGVPVDVVTARSGSITVTREIVGEVLGARQSVLRASDDYKIAEVLVHEGERVRRGQTLVRYDVDVSPDNMARLAQVQETYDNAKRQVDRLEPLFEQGAVAESELDAARTRLAIAAADLRNARLELEVVSPIDGVAVLVPVARGDAVASGEVVAQVALLDSVRVVADVSGATAREITKGDPVRPADVGDHPAGRITRVALAADPDTRLFRVEAVMSNPGRRLQPGAVVTLVVTLSEVGPVTVVPQAAVLGAEAAQKGKTVDVFVVRGGAAHKTAVEVGEVTEDSFEARSGVSEGDHVVVFGANRLDEGTKTRLHRVDGQLVPAEGDGSSGGGEAR